MNNMKRKRKYTFNLGILLGLLWSVSLPSQEIPLPEHPRPDFQREQWINLNGNWKANQIEYIRKKCLYGKINHQ